MLDQIVIGTINHPLESYRAENARRCLFVNTYYDEFLNQVYAANPALKELGYEEQLHRLQNQSFGDSDFYSNALIKAGWQAQNIIINCPQLQERWAIENNFRGTLQEVAVEQIKRFQPDVVYCQDMHAMDQGFLNLIRPHCRLIVGQIASAMGDLPLKSYDIIVSSILPFVEWFRELGIAAYYQPLAFETRLLQKLNSVPYHTRPVACSFVGGLYSRVHKGRQELLERMAKELPAEFWGYGANNLPSDSSILPKYRGEAWGDSMFQALLNSKITVNVHAEHRGCGGPLVRSKEDSATEFYANNMRLYEATGCGALLITDYKDNLSDLFEIGKEVVAYRSVDECIALIKYYLKNPQEAERIAAAGQRRTLETHSYALRLNQTAEILNRHLKNKSASAPVNLETISYGYAPLESSGVPQELTEGWKDEEIPARQRALVKQELTDMYHGKVRPIFQVLAGTMKPLLREKSSVLEIGCSSGYYYEIIEYLTNKEIAYTGVDYSPKMIELARECYPSAKFEVKDGANLGFKDAAYEIVISGCVLLHVPNYAEHIAETCRVAKEIVIAHRTPVCKARPTQTMRKFAYGVPTVELRLNEGELVGLFRERGWELLKLDMYESNPAQDVYEGTYVFSRRPRVI